jgi:hypothetical protein
MNYVPKTLSKRDSVRQKRGLARSRKAYKRGVFVNRPQLASFQSKKSSHVERATTLYGVSMTPTPELARATGCRLSALRQIVKKGEGAFYSSGSRPNQTPQSWAHARLASALTGGPASRVDFSILKKGCAPKSRPMRLVKKV